MQQFDLSVKKMGCYNQCKFWNAAKPKRTKIRAGPAIYTLRAAGFLEKTCVSRFPAFPGIRAQEKGLAHRFA